MKRGYIMSYPITQDFIPGLPQQGYAGGIGNYSGVCCHSTDDMGATDTQEDQYFHNNWNLVKAFPNFIVGWTRIIESADRRFQSWACANGNSYFVNIELCETTDPVLFKQSYDMYVWLIAKLLLDRNLGVFDGKTCVSHDWVSKNLGGTNHNDPEPYLLTHGINWAQHIANVTAEYTRQAAPWVWFTTGGYGPGPDLDKVLGYINARHWFYIPTRKDDGTLMFKVGQIQQATQAAIDFEGFLKTNNYWYQITND
jgi:hypothetical protein